MRIAVSNPDNIGDFILRQPMLAALLEAGHEILLIVRDFVAPLATDLFPNARVLRCAGNPYGRDFSLAAGLGQEMLREVKAFAPDLFVAASFQYTQLEEQLAAELPEVDCIGFTGHLFQARPETTSISTIRFATRVSAGRDAAELEKNELLCAAVLGHPVKLERPRMEAQPQALAAAAARLAQLGLDGRPFWAVCAGDAPDKGVRNWRMEQWAELCQGLTEKAGATLLFAGSPDEHAATVEIQNAMGQAGLRTATITGEPLELSVLTGILQLSEGYIGKDTGPMHIAAALGKPVLAVFGGGTWPRFIPAAQSGAVFTVSVPCTGCDWACYLSRSHCVKDIPVAAVMAKAETMMRGRTTGFSVEVLQPDPVLGAAILRDLLASAQTARRNLTADRANFTQWHEDRLRDIAQLREELDTATGGKALPATQQLVVVEERANLLEERAAKLEFESRLAIGNLRQETEDRIAAQSRLDRFRPIAVRKIADGRAKVEALRTANAALEKAAGKAIGESAEWKARWESAASELDSLRERLEEESILTATLRTRADTEDGRFQGLLADQEQLLKRKSAELASALALIPDLREELASLTADLAAREERVSELERGLAERESRIEQLESCGEEMEREHENTRKLLTLVNGELRAMGEDHAARLVVINTLAKDLEEVNHDRAEKQKLIDTLLGRIEVSEGDRERRLEAIRELSARLAESEGDRERRLEAIRELSARLAESEQDRAERLRLIEDISARLAASEQDREDRLRLIERLSGELIEKEADRADRGEQITKLHADLAALRNLLPYRILKQVRRF